MLAEKNDADGGEAGKEERRERGREESGCEIPKKNEMESVFGQLKEEGRHL